MIIWLTRRRSSLTKDEYLKIVEILEGFAIHVHFEEPIQKFWSKLTPNGTILVSGVESLSEAQRYSLEIEEIEIFVFEDPKSFFKGIQRAISQKKKELFAYVRAAVAPLVEEFAGCEKESLYLKKFGFKLTGLDFQNGFSQGLLTGDKAMQRLFHFAAHFHDIVYVGAGTGRSIRDTKSEIDWRDQYFEERFKRSEREIITFGGKKLQIGHWERVFRHRHYELDSVSDLVVILEFYAKKLFQPILVWNVSRYEELEKIRSKYQYFLIKHPVGIRLPFFERFQPIFFQNDFFTKEFYLYRGDIDYADIVNSIEKYRVQSRDADNNAYIIERAAFQWKPKTCFLNGASLIHPLHRIQNSDAIYTLRFRTSNGFPDYVSDLDEVISLQRKGKPAKSLKLIMLSQKAYVGSPTEASNIVLVNYPYRTNELPDVSVSTMLGLRHVSFSLRSLDSLTHRIADEIKSFDIDVSGHLLFNLIGNVEAIDFREWMYVVLSWSTYSEQKRKELLCKVVRVESGTEKDLQKWHSPEDFVAAIEVARRCSNISDENIEWLLSSVGRIRVWLSEHAV